MALVYCSECNPSVTHMPGCWTSRVPDGRYLRPLLSNRMRLPETRLVPPVGYQQLNQSENGATSAPGANNYYQRLRDATAHNVSASVNDELLRRVRTSSSHSHFGRCGSGWNNVGAYRDYGGRYCLFVDGRKGEQEQQLKQAKKDYLHSQMLQSWPGAEGEVDQGRFRSASVGASGPEPYIYPQLAPQWQRAHALRHRHVHRDYELEQARAGADSIDVTGILKDALQSGNSHMSRYSWRSTTE